MLVGALAGLVFAGVSTFDFVQHLDRQVHSLHCSFIPGAGAETGASGCQAAMMSPYSSVFRTSIWGGIPISLPAMAVFGFILFYAVDLLLGRRKDDPRATAFLALACALPALASVLMLTISLTKLGAVCKLCAGVYIASALCLTGSIMLWRRAVALRATNTVGTSRSGASLEVQVEAPATSNGFLAGLFGIGLLFVAVPIVLYAVLAPDHGKFIGTCGRLDKPADTYGVMVPVQRGGSTPALEILDPLCPACKAFEQRLEATGMASRLDRRAILFPLDTTCNWMITENTHPGACTVSEAVLCAGDKAPEVIRWAFEVQDRVRTETKADPAAAERMVEQRFPELAACVGSPEAKSRLNKSLRWAVANNIRVLTPQLFVNNVKLCDEDVDLGLDYALSRMLDGNFAAPPATPVEPTAPSNAPMPSYQTAQPPPAPPAADPSAAEPAAGAPPAAETSPAGSAAEPPEATPPEPAGDQPVTSPSGSSATPPPTDKPATDKPATETPPAATPPAATPPAEALPPEEKPAPAPAADEGGAP